MLLLLGAAFFGFEIINMMVSLQYETAGQNECVSTITQVNLCDAITHCKILSSSCLMAGVFLFVWRVKKANQL